MLQLNWYHTNSYQEAGKYHHQLNAEDLDKTVKQDLAASLFPLPLAYFGANPPMTIQAQQEEALQHDTASVNSILNLLDMATISASAKHASAKVKANTQQAASLLPPTDPTQTLLSSSQAIRRFADITKAMQEEQAWPINRAVPITVIAAAEEAVSKLLRRREEQDKAVKATNYSLSRIATKGGMPRFGFPSVPEEMSNDVSIMTSDLTPNCDDAFGSKGRSAATAGSHEPPRRPLL